MKFRFTIGRRIGLGFGILIFLTLFAFILTQNTLNKSRNINDAITNVISPSVAKLEELNLMVVRSKMYITNWVFITSSADNMDKVKLRKLINEDFPTLKSEIITLSKTWHQEEKNAVDKIFGQVESLFQSHDEVMKALNSFESYEDPISTFTARNNVEEGDVDSKTKAILEELFQLITLQQEHAKRVSGEMLGSFNLLQTVVRSLGLTLIIGGIMIAFFTVKTIVPPIHQLKGILLGLGRGVFPTDELKHRKDEIGEMSQALKLLVDGLKRTTEFSKEVGSGNFDSYYEPLSEEDTLGFTLLKMREDLRENERILEEKVRLRTEEVVKQKEEIEIQSIKLATLYKHVTDSIRYAKRIQEAILPPEKVIRKLLPDAFILYKPKDIVSGDFYWLDEKNGRVLIAAVDCTGHGVPGAFMSIVGYNILHRAVNEYAATAPGIILDELSKGVSETLHQKSHETATKDAMDITLCSIDFNKRELEFAGAFNPLYILRDNIIQEYKADKFPIGMFVGDEMKNFTNNKVGLKKGDIVYLFSDGYSDQFGGPHGKKFMAKQFKSVLLGIQNIPMQDQRQFLDKTIEDWRGNEEQVDDILVIGIRIS